MKVAQYLFCVVLAALVLAGCDSDRGAPLQPRPCIGRHGGTVRVIAADYAVQYTVCRDLTIFAVQDGIVTEYTDDRQAN